MTRNEAFDFLNKLAKGVSEMFGKSCEVVIHEVIDEEVWSIEIYNGHVSGRKKMTTQGIFGKPISIDTFDKEQMMQDHLNQLVIHPSGKMIKSSTFFLTGEDYQFALGINYDVTLFEQMKHMLQDITIYQGDLFSRLSTGNSRDLDKDDIFQSCLEILNKPIEGMKKEDRVAVVRLLKEKNFFSLQKSVPYVSEKLGISKYTIYKYINQLEQE